MTSKKYILTSIAFFVLLASAPVLFFFGIYFKENTVPVFYVFTIAACISLISAIVIIALNYKKLVAYDTMRATNKIKDLDFSVIEASINEDELREKLKTYGFSETAEKIYHKKVEDNVSDGMVTSHYYAALSQSDTTIDISKFLEKFSKGMTTYNIGYIFVRENIETNLEILRKYIKETVVDINTHRYGYKKFFSPIIITDNKIYYLKAGSFISEYQTGVTEGLRILGISK